MIIDFETQAVFIDSFLAAVNAGIVFYGADERGGWISDQKLQTYVIEDNPFVKAYIENDDAFAYPVFIAVVDKKDLPKDLKNDFQHIKDELTEKVSPWNMKALFLPCGKKEGF